MKKWYGELAKGQKILVYVIAAFLIFLAMITNNGFVFLASLIPMLVLIYFALGSKKTEA